MTDITPTERLVNFGPDLLTAAEDVLVDLENYVASTKVPGPDVRLANLRTAIINASGIPHGAQVPWVE